MQPHEAWLARAQEDLAVAKLCLREKYFSQTCFFSQQHDAQAALAIAEKIFQLIRRDPMIAPKICIPYSDSAG